MVDLIAPGVQLTSAEGIAAHQSGLATNPDMGYVKSLTYIDSTIGYFCPRIVNALMLPGNNVGINSTETISNLSMYPNPTNNTVTIHANDQLITKVEIFNTSGKLVAAKTGLNRNSFQFNYLELSKGMYLVNIHLNDNKIIKKLIIE